MKQSLVKSLKVSLRSDGTHDRLVPTRIPSHCTEAEQLFDELCLTEALDSYREQLLRLQRAFLGLSGLRSRVYNGEPV